MDPHPQSPTPDLYRLNVAFLLEEGRITIQVYKALARNHTYYKPGTSFSFYDLKISIPRDSI